VLTGNARQAQEGQTTQSADQFGDPGVQEILRLAAAVNARAIVRRRRRFRRRAFALLSAVLALCSVAAFRVGFEAGDRQTHSTPDFVWPAAKRADHYRIEFLLGVRVVRTAETSVPRLHVTATKLPPGSYRWRVWALEKSGARVGSAIVDASVTLR
jgi:hypothetical protein